ncbi:hypothetical protein QBC46DRAFT_382951 [Diplogelasinospora grovesii]|uniref:Uncharacterized protein n=1 Tax=Diplogelasinospora grovesii TaxID=303347 RepID=A0AAN6NCQ0_9PEZI|nr:hypothetical protein QBC46DRAFT_382951 [Diplogelasinospora grovesii]
MPDFARLLLERFREKWRDTTTKQTSQKSPTVAWLLAHRDERLGKPAQCKGATPTASLYRMYEYLVVGYITGLRSEIEYFYNQATWAVSTIPDPMDPDPERYAILAVLPYYLVTAFNRLIERGLPRGSPAIIAGAAAEEELRGRDVVLEEEPSWVAKVPALPQTLIIPDKLNKEPEEETRSKRFLEMNIIAEEPHVLFV